jgi:hypothetical protein
MKLQIRNQRTHELARRLAEKRKVSMTEALQARTEAGKQPQAAG